jgi:hypothetical protein
MAQRFWTDLDLHGEVPARALPQVGEWGPQRMPTTRGKKALRLIVPGVLLLATAGIVILGSVVFHILTTAVGL